jgi:hypothetical protein
VFWLVKFAKTASSPLFSLRYSCFSQSFFQIFTLMSAVPGFTAKKGPKKAVFRLLKKGCISKGSR